MIDETPIWEILAFAFCPNYRPIWIWYDSNWISQNGFMEDFFCWKKSGKKKQLSNVQNPVDIPLYWLVDRDPYNGLL